VVEGGKEEEFWKKRKELEGKSGKGAVEFERENWMA
jgi:hypothetical protein